MNSMNIETELQPVLTTAMSSSGLWDFPALYLEVLSKTEGLHFIVGPKQSGKTTALKQILFHIGTGKRIVNLKDVNSWEQPSREVSHADIIVMDHRNLAQFDRALDFAEMGYKVIMTLPFLNMNMGLERFFDLCGGDRAVQQRRLSQVLKSAVGLRLMPGTESSIQGAFELMLATSEVRAYLKSGDLDGIQLVMKNSGDRTGMRTLNQALLQLLLKRKVDWKVGFDNSPQPEELDALLKKIGI